MEAKLSAGQLEALGQYGTCVVANAIETFQVRLRNTGFADASIRCVFEELPPMVGYAAPARVRGVNPPMQGQSYHDRTDWWNYLLSIPAPRVVVLQDMDPRPGLGSFVGAVHATILQALGCTGLVTNGAVRGLDRVKATGFQMFAGNIAVSHAYSHIFEFGSPVEVGSLKISPGDILHGDRHGIVSVPEEIAWKIPAAAEKLLEKERAIVGLCRSPQFSVERLRELLKNS
jgi:4-hydroxy-4-methyl-2-oxoglutarate aldolase